MNTEAKYHERVKHLAHTYLKDQKTGIQVSITLYRSLENGQYSLGILTGFRGRWTGPGLERKSAEEAKKIFRRLQERHVTFKEALGIQPPTSLADYRKPDPLA